MSLITKLLGGIMSEKKHHKKKISPISIVVIIFFAILIVYSAATGISGKSEVSQSTVDMDALAQCLIKSDATFYGTEWCSHCANQKAMLGDVFDQFRSEFYVDCDADTEACHAAGITGYPTWIINGQRLVGVQPLKTLAQAMNCDA